jgi:hypothetical protein
MARVPLNFAEIFVDFHEYAKGINSQFGLYGLLGKMPVPRQGYPG